MIISGLFSCAKANLDCNTKERKMSGPSEAGKGMTACHYLYPKYRSFLVCVSNVWHWKLSPLVRVNVEHVGVINLKTS